jgi:hypothetical protein
MHFHRPTILVAVITLVTALGLPGVSAAAGIGFRNETDLAIRVQGAVYVNGAILRSPSFVVPVGQTGWDFKVPVGNRLIYIYDAQRPNRTLFKGMIQCQGKDMLFVVRPNLQPTTTNPYPVTVIHLPKQKQ